MSSKTTIALAAVSFVVGVAALTPAVANYAPCYENPEATGCPGAINQNTKAQNYRAAGHQTHQTSRHHG